MKLLPLAIFSIGVVVLLTFGHRSYVVSTSRTQTTISEREFVVDSNQQPESNGTDVWVALDLPIHFVVEELRDGEWIRGYRVVNRWVQYPSDGSAPIRVRVVSPTDEALGPASDELLPVRMVSP